jgi:hypothetical protein
MMHDAVTAKWSMESSIALVEQLAGCVTEDTETFCPSVYCGDVTIDFKLGDGDQIAKVESNLYVTGNLSLPGLASGMTVNCSSVFRPCHMEGKACAEAEERGQKNRPLSLAIQYDEVSVQWDWAAPSGAAALTLLKPTCPHAIAKAGCSAGVTDLSTPCLTDCARFDGLYYSTVAKSNESYHYYAPIAHMPTSWTAEIYKIVVMSGKKPCSSGESLSQGFVKKMYLAKLYADKLDTLASERFTIINAIHMDALFTDPVNMLKDILSGSFMYCYKGYECGFSLYDAAYLANMVAAMTTEFLADAFDKYASFDTHLSDMMGDYYSSTQDMMSQGFGAGSYMYMTSMHSGSTYGSSWLSDYYSSEASALAATQAKFYYYQYANTKLYPGDPGFNYQGVKDSTSEALYNVYLKLLSCSAGDDQDFLDESEFANSFKSDMCKPELVCAEACSNSFMLSDGNCDDGGPGSEFMKAGGTHSFCEPGSDCEDCGDRWLIWNVDTGYVDFCDNVKACAESFGKLGHNPPPPPMPPPIHLRLTCSMSVLQAVAWARWLPDR